MSSSLGEILKVGDSVAHMSLVRWFLGLLGMRVSIIFTYTRLYNALWFILTLISMGNLIYRYTSFHRVYELAALVRERVAARRRCAAVVAKTVVDQLGPRRGRSHGEVYVSVGHA